MRRGNVQKFNTIPYARLSAIANNVYTGQRIPANYSGCLIITPLSRNKIRWPVQNGRSRSAANKARPRTLRMTMLLE